MLMRKIHGGFNQVGSEASSDEEEEDSEDTEDDDEDQQPAPSSVINISINNKKTQCNELFRALLDSGTLGCLATAEAVKRAGIKQQTATKPKSSRTAAGRFHTTVHIMHKCVNTESWSSTAKENYSGSRSM